MTNDDLPVGTVVLAEQELQSALMGIAEDGLAVYNYDKLVDAFMELYGWCEEDAIDWIDYNVIGSGQVHILYFY